MKKIILHWTGGASYPNSVDLEHYHYVIDKDGKVYNGYYEPKDNLNCYDGKYAKHTGGGNTGSIGVAVCGMANFNGDIKSTKYLLTSIQIEKLFYLTAQLCSKYNIEITPDTGEHRTKVFYCDPLASRQKGACEKNHEYIRYILPKGTSLLNL